MRKNIQQNDKQTEELKRKNWRVTKTAGIAKSV